MGMVKAAIIGALVMTGGALCAEQGPIYSADILPVCLSNHTGQETTCIGKAAEACMATFGGMTTVGMGTCLHEELLQWDAMLNVTYQRLMAQEKATDAEMKTYGANEPSRAEPLREMQRAWIPYRDAQCDYERAQWGTGTGGGPAYAGCMMRATAEQTLVLQRFLGEE